MKQEIRNYLAKIGGKGGANGTGDAKRIGQAASVKARKEKAAKEKSRARKIIRLAVASKTIERIK